MTTRRFTIRCILTIAAGLITCFFLLPKPSRETITRMSSQSVTAGGRAGSESPRGETDLIGKAASHPPSTISGKSPLKIIDDLVRDESIPADETALRLFDLADRLTGSDQDRAVAEGVLLLNEPDYDCALSFLLRPGVSAEVQKTIMTDLKTRSDYLRLPSMLKIAQEEGHSYRETAAGFLRNRLDADYGADWSRWQSAVEGYLAEPPPSRDR